MYAGSANGSAGSTGPRPGHGREGQSLCARPRRVSRCGNASAFLRCQRVSFGWLREVRGRNLRIPAGSSWSADSLRARCWRYRRRAGQGGWSGEWSAACEVRRAGAGARRWDRGGATGGAGSVRLQPAGDQPAVASPPSAHAAMGVRRWQRAGRAGGVVRNGDCRGDGRSASGELHEPVAAVLSRLASR
jgi:hypothetical protein